MLREFELLGRKDLRAFEPDCKPLDDPNELPKELPELPDVLDRDDCCAAANGNEIAPTASVNTRDIRETDTIRLQLSNSKPTNPIIVLGFRDSSDSGPRVGVVMREETAGQSGKYSALCINIDKDAGRTAVFPYVHTNATVCE